MNSTDKKEITDYFRSNIFEALQAYTSWKMIYHARSNGVVSKEMAEHYSNIQNKYNGLFIDMESAFLMQFVMLSLHAFDGDRLDRSFSLYKVDKIKTKQFIIENKEVLDCLFNLRNKLFAHRAIDLKEEYKKIPSLDALDNFFKNLMDFYNSLTRIVDDSSTIFSNAEDIKYYIEYLYMNLYLGEKTRKHEVDIDISWEDRKDKISDVI